MSDLSITRDALRRSASQLPVSSYFDAALYERERGGLFQPGPRYVGHALAVPDVGDFHTLVHEGDGRALVRTADGIELLSNVCRHRQALMLRGRGRSPGSNIVCPLHRWTYDLHGALIAAPHFEQDPCLNLTNYPLQNWNGLLFEANGCKVATDLAGLGARADLDFSGYVYDRTHLHECDYNWKTFIEVYLEDYHVGPFHPGLSNFVSCDDLQWEMGRDYSVQTVGVAHSGGEALGRAGSPAYQRWQDAVMRFQNGKTPRFGAVWLTYYPGVMVEWYPQRAGGVDADPQGPAQDAQRGRVLLSRRDRGVRARVCPGPAGGLSRDLCRGRRDRPAHGRRPPSPDGARRRRRRPLPEPDGGRHAALPRVVPRALGDATVIPTTRGPSAPVLMLASAFLFSLMAVGVKWASEHYDVGELVFYRSLIGVLFITALARVRGTSLRTQMPSTHFWRSATGVASLALWFYSLGGLPLGTAMTLNYMSSVWMALFLLGGAVMLGAARVDGRLVASVLVGFAGVALVLRPTLEEQQLWHGLAGLLSGLLAAMAYLQVTALGRAGEPEARIVFYFSIGGLVLGALWMALHGASDHSPGGVALLLAIGLLGHDGADDDDARVPHRPYAVQRQPAVPGHRLFVHPGRAGLRRHGDPDGAGRHGADRGRRPGRHHPARAATT